MFELTMQADLDALYALYEQWPATLDNSLEAIDLCDALDDFIGACIEDGGVRSDSVKRAYLDLVARVQLC